MTSGKLSLPLRALNPSEVTLTRGSEPGSGMLGKSPLLQLACLGNDFVKLSVTWSQGWLRDKNCPDQLLISVKSSTVALLGQNHLRSSSELNIL